MDSAVRTGTRLRTLIVRLLLTAGFTVTAWLLGSLMAGSASASTASGQAETTATTTQSSHQGLLGGLLGGVGDVVNGLTGHPADEDQSPGPNATSDSDTATDESPAATLPGLLASASSRSSSGTASTSPAESVVEQRQQTSEPPSVSDRVRPTAPEHRKDAAPAHRATPKRVTSQAVEQPEPTKTSTETSTEMDGKRQAKEPTPPGPPAPQTPPAPTTAASAGHDTTSHGKNWHAVTAKSATLAPPAATGTAIDHRATAVDRHRDRPAAAPD